MSLLRHCSTCLKKILEKNKPTEIRDTRVDTSVFMRDLWENTSIFKELESEFFDIIFFSNFFLLNHINIVFSTTSLHIIFLHISPKLVRTYPHREENRGSPMEPLLFRLILWKSSPINWNLCQTCFFHKCLGCLLCFCLQRI